MSDDTQKLQILVGLYELAISRLFETVPGGDGRSVSSFRTFSRSWTARTSSSRTRPRLRPTKRCYDALAQRRLMLLGA